MRISIDLTLTVHTSDEVTCKVGMTNNINDKNYVTKVEQLYKRIRSQVSMNSVVHSDKWRGYDDLVDVGYEKHFRVDHGKGEYVSDNSHINGIEGFWGFAKTRPAKFHGMPKSGFYLHLKECAFRFNSRSDDMYKLLLKIIRQNPLFQFRPKYNYSPDVKRWLLERNEC